MKTNESEFIFKAKKKYFILILQSEFIQTTKKMGVEIQNLFYSSKQRIRIHFAASFKQILQLGKKSRYSHKFASQRLQFCSNWGRWTLPTWEGLSQAHLAQSPLVWLPQAQKISKNSHFLSLVLMFKRSYLGFYRAHSTQPVPRIQNYIDLSKNNRLAEISTLEKKFWPKIAKIGCLQPPGQAKF